MKKQRALLLVIAVVVMLAAIWAYVLLVTPAQETLDQRVHDVASQLKCPVCQGESVADSPAQISQQMRGIIRQQLKAGKSEQEVIQYFRNSCGDQIVWSPPWQGFTLLAWLVPICLMLGGIIVLFFVLRDWRMHSSSSLSLATSTLAEESEPSNTDDTDLASYRTQLE